MPHYPSSYIDGAPPDPNVSDNIAERREFRDYNISAAAAALAPGEYPTDYPISTITLSGSTNTFQNVVDILNGFAAEITLFEAAASPLLTAANGVLVTVFANGIGTAWLTPASAPSFTVTNTATTLVATVLSNTLASLTFTPNGASSLVTETVSGATFTVLSPVAPTTALLTPSTIALSTPESMMVLQGTGTAWTTSTVFTVGLTPPVITNVAATSGGHLVDATTYYYVVQATNAAGNSLSSNELVATTGTPGTGLNLNTLSWTRIPGATGYKVYRTVAGTGSGAELLLATIGSGATVTYADSTAGVPSGALPTTDASALGCNIAFQKVFPNAQLAVLFLATGTTAGTLDIVNTTDVSVATLTIPAAVVALGCTGSLTSPSELSWFANKESLKIAHFQRRLLMFEKELRRLTAWLVNSENQVSPALGGPSVSRYPSGQNRGY